MTQFDCGKRHLNELTSLRFIAALLVFVSHLGWPQTNTVLKTIFSSGYVGVSIFFVLSGFVMAHSYRYKIIEKKSNFRTFALRRIARIFPTHCLVAAIILIFSLVGASNVPYVFEELAKNNMTIGSVVANLTLLQSWAPSTDFYFSLNGPSWSLSNEMFFYIAFFFIAAFSIRKLVWLTATLTFLVITMACLFFFLDVENVVAGALPLSHWLFYIFPVFRLVEFLFGILIFFAWQSGCRPPRMTFLLSYILLAVFMAFGSHIANPFQYSLYFLPVCVLIVFTHTEIKGVIGYIYRSRLLITLGQASFVFYLLHLHLIRIFGRFTVEKGLGDWQVFFLTSMLITLVSVSVHVWIEKPMTEFFHSKINDTNR